MLRVCSLYVAGLATLASPNLALLTVPLVIIWLDHRARRVAAQRDIQAALTRHIAGQAAMSIARSVR